MANTGFKHSRRRNDDALARMDPLAFERLIADYYGDQGWEVEHSGTGGAGRRFDGGIDLKLRRGNDYIVVECKRWNAYQVPHNDVHELLGIMLTEGASGAIFVCSGEFTAHARKSAARDGRIQLVEGVELRRMLGPSRLLAAEEAASRADAEMPMARRRLSSGNSAAAALGEWEPIGRRPFRARKQLAPWGAVLGGCVVVAVLAITRCGSSSSSFETVPRAAVPGQSIPQPAPVIVAPLPSVAETPASEPLRSRTPTPAEAREAKRRADEAMKVIEAHTPAM